MDRIDAMKVFVSAVDEGSLAGAGRRLGRSPAAVSRAIAFLEAHVGAELLHRTTRALKLSEAGERYVAACRRVLVDLEEAEIAAGGERAAPRGILTLTAPIITGEDLIRPVVDAFLNEYPAVSVRLLLIDRQVNLIDEGIDVALRIAHLADSSFVAIRLGEVRRVITAAPAYLCRHPIINEPADLAKHRIVSMTHFGQDSWSFPPLKNSSVPRMRGPNGCRHLTHLAVGFLIRPLPRHSAHFGGKTLRPGCIGCLTFWSPVPLHAEQVTSVKSSCGLFIAVNH